MNLTEVIVAAVVFLGACSGAAQMGAGSAAAMSHSRVRASAIAQIETQFLAVAPLLAAARTASPERSNLGCREAAHWMQAELLASLPPLAAPLQRDLRLTDSGEQLQLSFSAGSGLQRQRLLSPAAYGLCGAPAPTQQVSDAAL